jgi:hypothetical protein
VFRGRGTSGYEEDSPTNRGEPCRRVGFSPIHWVVGWVRERGNVCENTAGSSLVAGLRRIAVPAAVALTNYAGTAPIPRASGTRWVVLACYDRSRATWGTRCNSGRSVRYADHPVPGVTSSGRSPVRSTGTTASSLHPSIGHLPPIESEPIHREAKAATPVPEIA